MSAPRDTTDPSLATGTTDLGSVLESLQQAGLYRTMRVIDSAQGRRVQLDGREVLLLCSNDYLGLASHQTVRNAAADAAHRWGAGAGASRLVSGNMTIHQELEAELAEFKRYPACVLFGSGFLANTGVIGALTRHDDVILSDALNHASIIDGCRQSRAHTIVYKHCDLDSLAKALVRAAGRRTLIITEGVFSMDGDLAPLPGIADLAHTHGARIIVDEAHATGVIGPGGRGLVSALALEGQIDIVIGTLGKALGSYGAFACCDRTTADFLINRARTLIYSTALPPPQVAAALAALRIVRQSPSIVDRLRGNALLLRQLLADHGLAVPPDQIPIIPLILGEPDTTVTACQTALRNGVFAQAIRPPTVPPGTSRLRLVATAAHTHDDLILAATTIAAATAFASFRGSV